MSNIAGSYEQLGDFNTAIEYYQKALKIDKNVHEENHPNIGLRYNNLGAVHVSVKKFEKATAYYLRAIMIFEKHYGEDYIDLATTYNNLGLLYYRKQSLDESILYLKKSKRIYNNYYTNDRPQQKKISQDLSRISFLRGRELFEKNKFSKALENFKT